MSRITALLIGIASLIGITTVAEAADVPHQAMPSYGYGPEYGPPAVHEPGSQLGLGPGEAAMAKALQKRALEKMVAKR